MAVKDVNFRFPADFDDDDVFDPATNVQRSFLLERLDAIQSHIQVLNVILVDNTEKTPSILLSTASSVASSSSAERRPQRTKVVPSSSRLPRCPSAKLGGTPHLTPIPEESA
eukprot:CAMPEP_0118898688 /NCGR_PEP_ID=MMETSP1166-20130328/5567_1 /TAXON_ID=1104430 /ORGANISM="Chrysoreinhardia sp, Strain CCMP3193" /LENGTH=111 /DNA_ID=CAMNT_0006837799 /DNA_START=21 /DNA_END=356 /DNA_ORIENTATION=+